jgi:hypothetical protein
MTMLMQVSFGNPPHAVIFDKIDNQSSHCDTGPFVPMTVSIKVTAKQSGLQQPSASLEKDLPSIAESMTARIC